MDYELHTQEALEFLQNPWKVAFSEEAFLKLSTEGLSQTNKNILCGKNLARGPEFADHQYIACSFDNVWLGKIVYTVWVI